uniref:Uncharacterized protein n=1 Tax=Oryza glumipatula TaxID=40148 RepID=A0A0E0A0T1_9ORYZ
MGPTRPTWHASPLVAASSSQLPSARGGVGRESSATAAAAAADEPYHDRLAAFPGRFRRRRLLPRAPAAAF